MPVDISKVFKANVKAIRISLTDADDKNELLNEELFGKSKRRIEKKKNESENQLGSIAKELRSIVSKLNKRITQNADTNFNKKVYYYVSLISMNHILRVYHKLGLVCQYHYMVDILHILILGANAHIKG